MRLALVSSVGGHLTELLELRGAFADWEMFWIVNDISPVLPDGERVYRISHGERDWRVVWNVVEVAAIFAKERPDLMLSMGASPAVSAAVVARSAGVPIIYVEPSSAVTRLTLTGRLMRHLATRFYVQWERLRDVAPGAKFEGTIL